MQRSVLIDGNNLLFAVEAHAPVKALGREALVRRIEQWAKDRFEQVVLAFDGAAPAGGLGEQIRSTRIDVRFSAPRSADDLIAELIHGARDPGGIEVISDDKAILYEARLRNCRTTTSKDFVERLFPSVEPIHVDSPDESDKPESLSAEDQAFWRREFQVDDEDTASDDGLDAMRF